jgi:putative acetyltransferase
MNHGTLSISSMTTPAEADAFRTLNEEWIAQLFTIEDSDRKTLGDPFGAVVDKGGDVLILRDGEEIVGCVAVAPGPGRSFELSKMAVTPRARGRGIGRRLIQAAIDRARELGAATLFLGSSTKLPDAVHLYESFGFIHVPAERIALAPYARADVFMELVL